MERKSSVLTGCSLTLFKLKEHLRSQKNGCCSYKLQFPSQNRHAWKKPVQEVDSQVESLCSKLILFTDLNEPVHQNHSHAFCDVWLLPHVVCFGPVSYLFGKRVLILKYLLCQKDHSMVQLLFKKGSCEQRLGRNWSRAKYIFTMWNKVWNSGSVIQLGNK